MVPKLQPPGTKVYLLGDEFHDLDRKSNMGRIITAVDNASVEPPRHHPDTPDTLRWRRRVRRIDPSELSDIAKK